MDIRMITQDFSVSPQIAAADLLALRAHGFRSVICNRPDGEEPGQPSFAEIAEAARMHGLEPRHVPVQAGMIGTRDVAAFVAALDGLPLPVLAYCRSGARSATLWLLCDGRQRLDTVKQG